MTYEQVFQRLSALCARGEHCQYEMTEKMRQWDVDEQTQARLMARLVGERYIDDKRYAHAYVRDKIRYSHWGRRKVEQGLWQKHIDADIIEEALGEVDDSEYLEVLRPLLRQKARSTTGKSDYERRMKLMKWAAGRGFTMDIIRQCMDVSDEDELLD